MSVRYVFRSLLVSERACRNGCENYPLTFLASPSVLFLSPQFRISFLSTSAGSRFSARCRRTVSSTDETRRNVNSIFKHYNSLSNVEERNSQRRGLFRRLPLPGKQVQCHNPPGDDLETSQDPALHLGGKSHQGKVHQSCQPVCKTQSKL